MTSDNFLRLLDELLELPSETLDCASRLSEFSQWDSLAFVGFIALVDRHFGVSVDPSRIAEAETVDDLLAMVRDHLE